MSSTLAFLLGVAACLAVNFTGLILLIRRGQAELGMVAFIFGIVVIILASLMVMVTM